MDRFELSHSNESIIRKTQDTPNSDRPVVTLCGSSTQKEDWEEYQRELALKGYCVLAINVYLGRETLNHNEENEVKQLLRELHRQKIRMADIVAIIPKADGSIGSHTTEEVAYAKQLGKQVVYISRLLGRGV